jgi:hypothetical protein
VCSSGSPVPRSVEQPEPSNGQSPSTLVQLSARTKLSTTPSTNHIVSSPSEAHSYLREDLPVVGPKKAIKVTDISPISKYKNKSAMKTGCKADRSEEITGSPYTTAIEIKDALKSKGKAHAKKALNWTSQKIQAGITITKHFVFTAMTIWTYARGLDYVPGVQAVGS